MTPDFEKFRTAILYLLTAGLAVLLGIVWWPFFPAMAFALVVTLLTNGWYQRVRRRFEPRFGDGKARTLSALVVVLGLCLAFFGPLAALGTLTASQANQFVTEFNANAPDGVEAMSGDYVAQKLDEAVSPIIKSFGFDFSVAESYEKNKDAISEGLRKGGGNLAKSVGLGILIIVIGFLTSFFLMRDGPKLLDPVCRLLPLSRDQVLMAGDRIYQTTHAVLIGIVLVSIIQGTLAGIVYAIAGVPNSLMWGVATIVVCMIPLLGGPIVYAPIGLLLLSQGKVWQGAMVLGVGFGFISQIDNLLRPFFIGSRTSLHPMAIFFSLLGGVLMFGPLGLFMGPILLTLVLTLIEFASLPKDAEPSEPATATG